MTRRADGRAGRAGRPPTASACCASPTTRTWCWPTCRSRALPALWRELEALGLATPNIGTLTDMICCPGLDFCSLANAGSIPIAKQIQRALRRSRLPVRHRSDRDQDVRLHERLRPSPRRPHRHSRRRQARQGVVPDHDRRLSRPLRPRSARSSARRCRRTQVADTIARLLEVYVRERQDEDERFVDAVRRIGVEPFQERVYETDHSPA